MSTSWHPEDGLTADAGEIDTMARVLEARHGHFAFEIAEFFASAHGHNGDAPRSWAWNVVAETIRRREHLREGVDHASEES